jgi:putative hydrolase of the HAD superfamily
LSAPVEAVLIDVGGVFVVPDHELLAPVIADAGGSVAADVLDRAHYAGVAAMDGVGFLDWKTYNAAMARSTGVPEARIEEAVERLGYWFRTADLWRRILPGSVDGLRTLAAAGVNLAIVSNSDGTVERLLSESQVCQVGAGRGVQVAAIIDSHVVGYEKPDTRIFEIALEALGVAAGNAVHIGDTAFADVDGARAAGVRPLHLDPYGDCPRPPGDHEHITSLADVPGLIGAR